MSFRLAFLLGGNGMETDISTIKRIEWIDALKGFLIFCVTIGHCNVWAPIEKYIYSFHMFLFFFISGFLFSVKPTVKEMLIKCSKKIFLPFVCWNIISSLIGLIYTRDLWNFVEELFVINGNLTWNPTIWFLLVLFLAESIIIMLKLHRKKWISILTVVLSLALWVLIADKWLLWKANLIPMAIAFFLLGYLLKGVISILQRWYVIVLSGIGSVVFAMMNIRIVYTYGQFGNYIYCILAAFCGVLFFVGLFSKLKFFSKIPFLKEWGKNSLAIMAMQYFVFTFIKIASTKMIHVDLMKISNTGLALVITLITICIIMLFVCLLKKLAQRIRFVHVISEALGISYY